MYMVSIWCGVFGDGSKVQTSLQVATANSACFRRETGQVTMPPYGFNRAVVLLLVASFASARVPAGPHSGPIGAVGGNFNLAQLF